MGRTRPTPTSQLTHGDAAKIRQVCPCHGGSSLLGGGAISFHRLTRCWRRGDGVGETGEERVDAQGQRAVKLETREEDGDGRGGGGARGTIVVTGGQLEQIWESRNLSLRKDDPALSSAFCVRCCCHSTVCYRVGGMEISQFFKSGRCERPGMSLQPLAVGPQR